MKKHIDEMKAIILAAGYGTRLGDLGKNLPKAFMEIKNKPLRIAAAIINFCGRIKSTKGIKITAMPSNPPTTKA